MHEAEQEEKEAEEEEEEEEEWLYFGAEHRCVCACTGTGTCCLSDAAPTNCRMTCAAGSMLLVMSRAAGMTCMHPHTPA